MNKNFIYAMLSAIALTGTVGLSSCSSSEDLKVEDNPSYNAKTGEVGVDFVMNIATGNTASTRMSSANTQATESEKFRGIENAALMAFTLTDDGKNVATASTANKHYDMGTIMGAEAIDPDGTGSTPKSRRVIELSLPTGTNTLMFWGKAIKTASDNHLGNNQQGNIDWTMNKNLSNIEFTLKKRIPVSTTDPSGTAAFGQYESLIADVLTQLLEKEYACHATYNEVNYDETRAWKNYVTMEGDNLIRKAGLSPLGEIIADAFISLNTFKANEVRAGSGPSVAMMLGDLYEVINTVASAGPTSSAESITKAFAGHLKGDLATLVDTSNKKWQTTINSIKGLTGKTAEEQATAYNLVTRDLNDFPSTIFNVPQGATTLKLTITNKNDDETRIFKYDYNQTIPTYAMDGTAGGQFDPLNYRYPAELCYFGNSPVRVTDDPHVTTEYPDGTGNWDTDDSWAAGATGTGSKAWTKNYHVLSSTRSVAMQENINYGTALLKTTVRYGVGVLKDNNKAMHPNEEDNSITVGAGTFTLTGILIGGVEPTVGWNYIAKSDAPEYKSFIYDPDLPSTAIPATVNEKSVPNYTLVWDNWNVACHNSDSKQNVVYCALEFVNNSGQNFWGMNNMIRNGATFYISGKLDPDGTIAVADAADKSKGIDWPLARTDEKVDGKFHYALPPYDGSGNTIKERRVFIQDYMTTADFVIGENSLKSALVEVPDLRSSQISLGLSVDLKWQTGLNFSEITLGE